MKKNIAVLMGGYSHEAQISLKSGETVLKHIDKAHYNLYKVVIDENGWLLHLGEQTFPLDKGDFSVTTPDGKLNFDAVFIVIHGTPGEDGKLQAYFDMLGIPYTTAGILPLALTFNKFACNSLLKYHGVHCAPSVLIRKDDPVEVEALARGFGFPMFIKPCDGGSSFGVSKVKKTDEIAPAIAHALEHGTEVIIEAFVEGTEVSCGIFKLQGETRVLPPTEIVSKNEFFDFNAKYKGDSQEITPARLSEELTRKVQEITANAFRALGLRGLARIDFIIRNGQPVLIEVNTVPGLSEQSIIPQQLAHIGLSLSEIFGRMIEEAFER